MKLKNKASIFVLYLCTLVAKNCALPTAKNCALLFTDYNKCIIISTHQVKDLETLIDYITIIDEGKILFNHSINEILDKLTFKLSFNTADFEEALYSEPALTGQATILPHKENESGKIDLELLYKAVVKDGNSLKNIFNADMI